MEKYFEVPRQHQILRGMLHIPDVAAAPCPAVIFCHGFTSNMAGPHCLYVKLARALAQHGFLCVRFDFTGSGNSDGDFSRVTLTSEMQDGVSIYQYVKNLPYVDAGRIALLGHSMGSLAAMMTNAHLKGAIWKNVLMGTAGTLFHELIAPLTGSALDECLNRGCFSVNGYTVGRALLDDVYSQNFFETAREMSGQTLLIHGRSDGESPVYNSVALKEVLGERAELLLVDGADHCFSNEKYDREIVGRVLTFLQK